MAHSSVRPPLHRTRSLVVDGAHDVFAASQQMVHTVEDLVPPQGYSSVSTSWLLSASSAIEVRIPA